MRPPRILVLLCLALVAGGAVPGARSADDPYAALLAPSGVCGAAADQLSLDLAVAEQAMTCLTNYARTPAAATQATVPPATAPVAKPVQKKKHHRLRKRLRHLQR